MFVYSLQMLHCQSQAILFDILFVTKVVKLSLVLALESCAQLCLYQLLEQEETRQTQETYVASRGAL